MDTHPPFSSPPVVGDLNLNLNQDLFSPDDLASDESYPFIVVRALYPYRSEDSSTVSLSFFKDDLIQVVAQLESGWWYGFCNDARGWFPSNFVEEISQAELEDDDDDLDRDSDDTTGDEDDLWLPQTTPDGQVFFFNTRTKESSWSIPTSPQKNDDKDKQRLRALSSTSTSSATTAITVATTTATSTTSTSAATTTASTASVISSFPAHLDHTSQDRSDSTDSNGISIDHDQPILTKPPIVRENSSASSVISSRAGGGNKSAHESPESESRNGSTRPNSWQASAVPTRSGSPNSQNDFTSADPPPLTGVRKPSSTNIHGVLVEQGQDLPPLPSVPNPFESEPTWESLAEHITNTMQNLINSADNGYKAYYQVQAAHVVEAVRIMLYASGTLDKDASPIRMHRELKIHQRQIMAALSRLVLSAKMASSVWPAEGALAKMRSDTDDVGTAVRQFIKTGQNSNVTIHHVDAKLVADAEGAPPQSKGGPTLSRTFSSASRPSIDSGDRHPYRRSLGSASMLSQLDYYSKSACRSIGILGIHLSKILENPQSMGMLAVRPPGTRPLSGTAILNTAQSSQLVTQCQSALSQIGYLLALVNDYYPKVLADYPTIKDHIFLDVRVSKQALYNNVAGLVMSIQLATDAMAQTSVLEQALEAIQTAERSVMDLSAATRSLAAENDEAERQTRIRIMSGTSSTTLVGQSSSGNQYRQSEVDGFFMEGESDIDGETAKSSRQRSDSRPSSFSSNSSISGMSAPTTPGTEYTGHFSATYQHSHSTPTSPMEINPPTVRSGVSMHQKSNDRSAKLKKMLGEDAPMPKAIKVAEVPAYLSHDYSTSDISFNMEGHVKGGTLEALVERLTLHDGFDAGFVATFLLTYRSFTSTRQLFDHLFRRFDIAPPPGLTPAEHALWTDRKLLPIRLRVFNIIKSWLENYFLEDEEEDHQVLPKIKEFSESSQIRESMSFAAVQLIKLVEKRETSDLSFRKMVLNLSTQAPQPIMPRNLKRLRFLDIDPLEFARQLTILEANCYNRIKPVECLNKAWTSEDPAIAAKSANIKKMIEASNLYSNWINEIVMNEKDPKKRAAVIKHVISIGEKLRQLNNFSMLSATTAALAHCAVHRLKRTWELVPGRSMTALATLQNVMSSAKSWANYRQELHSTNPPCVPFLGIYLTDLVFIEDGNLDFIKGTDQHINFYKRVRTAEVIREIQQYQSVPYCLTNVREIQAYIRRGMEQSKSVQDLYEYSLELEPREGEEEKITRLLSESGFL
ncbi:MAG: ras guanine nucleotide exchange factor domain-containing protein [Benniella sp.]|nr:MAG: ras guanine nucleotide exchange factor domain-containing protein [Benniella sp.]